MTIPSIYDPSFAPTVKGVKSSPIFIPEQNLREVDFPFIFYLFQTFYMCIFVFGGVVTDIRYPNLFQNTARVVLDTFVSPEYLKSYLLVSLRLFTASCLIRDRKLCKTNLKWSLLALFGAFVGAATIFLTVWRYISIILEISYLDLHFAKSVVIIDVSEALKPQLGSINARLRRHLLINETSDVSGKPRQFVYTCA